MRPCSAGAHEEVHAAARASLPDQSQSLQRQIGLDALDRRRLVRQHAGHAPVAMQTARLPSSSARIRVTMPSTIET